MKNKLLAILSIVLPIMLSAQTSSVRKYSNEFLFIGASARGMAMSNAVGASVDDISAGYYNPAGLALIKNSIQLGFMHSEYFAGITSFDYGAATIKLDRKSVLGVSVIRFGADNIPNTFQLVDQNGGIDYSKVTNFSVADYAVMISYGTKYNERARYGGYLLRYGGSVKIIRRTVGPFAGAWGFGIDAGAQVDLDEHSTLSVMVKDATTTFNAWSFTFSDEQKSVLSQTGNDIPTHSTELTLPRIILGANRRFEFNKDFSLMGEAAIDITTDGKRNVLIASNPLSFDPHLGLEAAYKKTVYLRGGIGNFQYYTNDNPTAKSVVGFQPTIGIGLRLKKIAIDYAFTNLGSTSPGLYSHIIGLRLSIDRQKKR
jgi:hypothetical protein